MQIHHPDVHVPLAETLGALRELQLDGKLRHIGVSNFTPEQVREAQAALGDVPLATVQQDYSLVRRQVERELLPLCRDEGIALIAFSPLAEGVLAGRKIANATPTHRSIAAVMEKTLFPLAAQHQVSPVAIALAWLVAQPGVCSVISGASTTQQLDEQVQVMDLLLGEEEMSLLSDEFGRVPLPYTWEMSVNPIRRLARRGKRFFGQIVRKISGS